jgi:hypothetical protein
MPGGRPDDTMDILALLICAVISLAAAWVVAQPLLGGASAGPVEDGGPEDPGRRALEVEKGIVYQAISELDMDYAAGKLSEADYRALRAKQEVLALEILKALDAAPPGASETSAPTPKSGRQ